MVFKTCLSKAVLDNGGAGFSLGCSNHICSLYYVKSLQKGIGIFIIFNTGQVSLSEFLLVPPLC